MKKRVSIFLVFAIILTLIPLALPLAASAASITNLSDLSSMSPSGSYVLANDITITGTWDYSSHYFSGTFDGNGHTIYIANGATLKGGIFNQISSGAIIKNLTVVQLGSATYTTGKEYQDGETGTNSVGVLAGSCRTGTWGSGPTPMLIKNVTVYADVEVDNSNYNVGGLVGYMCVAQTIFDGCAFYGRVTNNSNTENGSRGAGGILGGTNYSVKGLLITNCVNYGSITAKSLAGGVFGGVGRDSSIGDGHFESVTLDGKTYSMTNTAFNITGCINYGSINGGARDAGGILGRLKNDTWRNVNVEFNINYGVVSNSKSGGYAGGIAGEVDNGSNYIVVQGNVNYGACTATSGTVAPITASCSKDPNVKGYNYCDSSTAKGGTNPPTVSVIPTDITAASAVSALNGVRTGAVVLDRNGKIIATWATTPVEISTLDGLKLIFNSKRYINATDHVITGYYKLTSDITISGTWDANCRFEGSFDGNGHTINIANGAILKGGVFNQIGPWAIIKDLTIKQLGSATYQIGQDYQDGTQTTRGIGALAGSCRSNWDSRMEERLIKNVTVYANISVTNNDYNVGGLVGMMYAAKAIFDGCVFHGSVINSGDPHETRATGGILGAMDAYIYGLLIQNCANFGTVMTGGQAGGIFGGVIATSNIDQAEFGSETIDGKTYSYSGVFMIVDGCLNYGSVTGRGANAAGIVGKVYCSNEWRRILVNFNINYGSVTNLNSGYAGGIGGTITRASSNALYIELHGSVNYGTCTASGGTKAPITVYCVSAPTGSAIYCTSTDGAGGTNTPSVTVISNASTAVTAINGVRSNAVVLGADGKIVAKWASDSGLAALHATKTTAKGTQMSTIENSKRNIRIVAGLSYTLNAVSSVGIQIKVFYSNGANCKTFEQTTTKVHSAVNTSTNDGKVVKVTAASLNVNYLYTATLSNVPTSVGTVVVAIRTFHVIGGVKYYGAESTTVLNIASE